MVDIYQSYGCTLGRHEKKVQLTNKEMKELKTGEQTLEMEG